MRDRPSPLLPTALPVFACIGRLSTTIRACLISMFVGLLLGTPIHSDETTPPIHGHPTDLPAVSDDGDGQDDSDEELSAILQLRQAIGISSLSGTSLETENASAIFADSLGKAIQRAASEAGGIPADQPVLAEQVSPDFKQASTLVETLRSVSAMLEQHAAAWEESGKYARADQLRRLARRNRKAARILLDDKPR